MIIGKLTYHSVLTPIHLQCTPTHTQPVKGLALLPAFPLCSARLGPLNIRDKKTTVQPASKISTLVITQMYRLYRKQ